MQWTAWAGLSPQMFGLAFLGAFILGVSKAGVKGIAVLIVTLMALAFGSKPSTGLLMPLLLVGDVFAIAYYHQHAQWSYLKRFLPWMMTGVLIGVWVGDQVDEATFQKLMGYTILGTVVMLIWWERKKDRKIPNHWAFAGSTGLMAGITTMIGNLAGAFSNVFFLAMRLPKQAFIGTAAWLFFFINVFKLPFHIWVWKTITVNTLLIDLWLLPSVGLGLGAGVFVVKKIPESWFRPIILVLTAFGALILFFR
jgi:uncharacterized membrane protein YfcA